LINLRFYYFSSEISLDGGSFMVLYALLLFLLSTIYYLLPLNRNLSLHAGFTYLSNMR